MPLFPTSSLLRQPLLVLPPMSPFSSPTPSGLLSIFLAAGQSPTPASYVPLQAACGPGATFRSRPFYALAVSLFESMPGPLSPFAARFPLLAVLFLFPPFNGACPSLASTFLALPSVGHY